MRMPLNVTILAILALPTLPLMSLAALADDIDATSAISQVTVFPSGAQVTRTAKITLPAGEHTIILRDLPERLVDSSLRVEGEGGGAFRIGGVDSKRIYVDVETGEGQLGDDERKRLEKQIEGLRDEKARLEARIHTAETQRRLMERLAEMPGEGGPAAPGKNVGVTHYTVDQWGGMFDLIGARILVADDLILKSRIEVREKDREIKKLQKRLSQQPPKKERQTQISVHVAADSRVEGELKIKYQVREAVWKPFYDARLSTGKDGQAPVLKLVRRGAIRQWSGEDWKDIRLSLSTTSPQKGTQAPTLYPEKVDILVPRPGPKPMLRQMKRRNFSFGAAKRAPMMEKEMAEDMMAAAPVAAPAPRRMRAREINASVRNYAFQAVFDIPGKVSVKASGDEKKVRINSGTFKPALKVKSAPKKNKNAYLYAEFRLPKDATALLPGKVALYRDGAYAGNGRLPLVAAGDKHELGFGVDDAVKVARTEVKRSKGETGLITTSKVDERRYELKVTNLHKTAIDVTLLDQIPYSVNEQVTVAMDSSSTRPSRRNVDGRRGVLAWDFRLPSGAKKLIRLNFTVAWPAAKQITGNYGH